MLPYYFLVAAPFLFSVVQFESQARMMIEKKKNYPILLFFAIYFLLLALRSELVGTDTTAYISVFDNVSNTAWGDLYNYKSTELGYTILNKVISAITNNHQIFLACVAAITVIPLAKLYYDESEHSMMTIALFLVMPVFIMNFSGLRQAIAIALGVPAFYAVKEKKPLRFLLFVLLAFTFHQSALVLLLMYPVYHIKIRPVHLFLLIPTYIFTYLNNSRIFTLLLPLLGEKYVERYSEVTDTGATTMIILFFLFLIYSFVVPDEKLMDDTTRGMRNFLVLALFLQMFSPISTITMRMNYYYIIFIPLLIPKITNRWVSVDKFITNVVKIVVVVFFIVYFFDKAYRVDSLNVYPYVPCWNLAGGL